MATYAEDDWHSRAISMSVDQNLNASEIAKILGMDYNKVRHYIKAWRKRNGLSRDTTGTLITKDHAKENLYYSNGITTYEREETIVEGKEITPELIMKAKGLNPLDWEVVSFVKNVWQSQTKEGKPISLCQSKLSVKPRNPSEVTFTDIDEYFESLDLSKKVLPKVKAFKPKEEGYVAEIDVTDLHIGLFSYKPETGNTANLEQTREVFLQGMSKTMEKIKRVKCKGIYFCTLGDILHIDNDKNTTTSGTFQDADGRLSNIFDFAIDTMRAAIEMMLELKVPVHYVYTCGNHDRNTGYFLVKVLSSLYTKNPNIDFDITPNPTKSIHFGKILIGLSHGDMNKKNRGIWMLSDCRRELGESDFIEEHSGHIHDEEVKRINGIICRSVLAQCGNSYWEHQQGYRSERGMMTFMWDEDLGLDGTWYYYY